MIVRVFWNSESHESPPPTAQTEQVLREEGGWWFSETFSSTGIRSCYKVISRHMLTDGKSMMELCIPLSDTFIATPCWQDGPPQIWIRRQGGWELPSGLMVFQGQPSQLPLELQVPEHLRTEVQRKLPPTMYDVSQGLKDSIAPLPPGQQHQTPQGVSPLRMKRPHESSSRIPGVPTHQALSSPPQGPLQGQPPQPESQVSASASPKVVQTGLLCSPKLLPDVPLPRKKGPRPQGRRGPPSQDHQCPPLCLIDPLLS